VGIGRATEPEVSRPLIEAAAQFMADAVRCAERVEGFTEVDVALVRLDLVQCLFLLNRTSACEKVLGQAAAVIEAAFPFDHVHRAEVLRLRGNVMLMRSRPRDAITLLQDAQRMYAACAGPQAAVTHAVASELETARQLARGILPSLSQLMKNLR
jgi:hypothetical protein